MVTRTDSERPTVRNTFDETGFISPPGRPQAIWKVKHMGRLDALHVGRHMLGSSARDANRQLRALKLARSDPQGVERLEDGSWLVRSSRGRGWCRVVYDAVRKDWRCNCPDFLDGREPCKHIHRAYLQWFPDTRADVLGLERARATKQEPRKRNYAAYDAAQIAEERVFGPLLRGLVDHLEMPGIRTRPVGRPPKPLADQVFIAIRKVASTRSCRRQLGELEMDAEIGRLPRAPGYVASSRFLNNPASTDLLEKLVIASALPLAAIEQPFAIDSTGIQTTRFAGWADHKLRSSRTKLGPEAPKMEVGRVRRFVKAHALVGAKTHSVVCLKVTEEYGSDYPQFESLVPRPETESRVL